MSRVSTKALAVASARHPWRIIGLWVVIIAIAFVAIISWLEDAFTQDLRYSNAPDSQVGADLLVERLTGPTLRNEVIIVRSDEHTVDDPAFEERVTSLSESITELGPSSIDGVLSYLTTGNDLFVSPDRRSALIQFQLRGSIDDTSVEIGPIYEYVLETSGEGSFQHYILGESSFAYETTELAAEELQRGESIGVPAALLILLVLFGSVLAALVVLLRDVVYRLTGEEHLCCCCGEDRNKGRGGSSWHILMHA